MTPLERRLLDEAEIQRLGAAYSHACMRLDGTAAAQTYARDGVLTAFHNAPLNGRDAIAAALQATLERLTFLAQSCTAGIITVDGDCASAKWTVIELFAAHADEGPSCCLGSYDDSLVRTDDGWRFAHRRFLPFYRGGMERGKTYAAPGFESPLEIWPPAPLG